MIIVDIFDVNTRLWDALSAEHPRARLQTLMAELLELGWERDQVMGTLETFRAQLAEAGRDEEEALIAEMIDGFTGWCRID